MSPESKQSAASRSARTASAVRRAAVAVVTAAAFAGLATSALAQDVTVFSDDFSSYTSGNNLPNGGASDKWASASPGGKTVVQTAANLNQVLFAQGGGNVQATTRVMNAGGIYGELTFDIRYTGDNGDATVDTPTDGGLTFDEFDASNDNLLVEYRVNADSGGTFQTLQTFAYNDGSYRTGFGSITIVLPSAALLSTLELRFSQPNGGGANRDQWAIDNVVVLVSTPEPGTWALFGMSVAGLGAWVQRRRRNRAAK